MQFGVLLPILVVVRKVLGGGGDMLLAPTESSSLLYPQAFKPVVFNLFCSRTPTCNSYSILYPQMCWCIILTYYTERPPLLGEISANFCGCHVVSVTDRYGRILGFLDRGGV
jgi:hypothetical protein